MARTLPSQREMVRSKGVIKKDEFVKVITRTLYSLGYNKTGALLEQESGIALHSSRVTSFMQLVLEGKWDESILSLRVINVPIETEKSAKFIILEQKFLELVQNGNTVDAMLMLRNEISPLLINTSRVHQLAACLISHSQQSKTICVSSRPDSLEKLQRLFPAATIVPEKRLEQLVEQALDMQRESCLFHNTLDSELSLYTDHQCARSQIPSETVQILQAHNDEVWYLQFSHNGKYLASASNDQSAIIWEVRDNSQLCIKRKLIGHQKTVCFVSWSPDDSQLLTCGLEEVVRRWDVQSGKCLNIYGKHDLGLVSCGWFPDGKRLFSGVTDKSICTWDLDGREVVCWKGQRTLRTSDIAITKNGKRIISIFRDTSILVHDKEVKVDRLIEEDEVIISFSLSDDNKFLLVNLINQDIHLWSLEGDFKVVSKYKGHKRTRFLIRSCFDGVEQGFIASGSEDSQVYIWHRGTGELLLALPGHSGTVNCVSWNLCNPRMMASASDDRTIRVWGLGRR
ncbi:WD repeat-containing protein 26 homolog isoform X1 [Spinacia oleracea]|uniref:WD repeat-containing protein 26 homolog isoform X1 n=2 Tax=Spinacia oleracea TaxID=3562 RepID=A0A9R0I417_SPIOL|nr:WD repeat-containing protein 26 homolog isoform X1 [Spinacia oleracea]XP_021841910.2 WD repeat-containing protein 26 homolog isoform X1 [Spinacia oleracea]